MNDVRRFAVCTSIWLNSVVALPEKVKIVRNMKKLELSQSN